MKQYVIKYISKIAEKLNINISDFYEMINTTYLSEYGVNFKMEAEKNNMNMIDYACFIDTIDDSFLFRLLSITNIIKREIGGKND